jgi:hypothetical protein
MTSRKSRLVRAKRQQSKATSRELERRRKLLARRRNQIFVPRRKNLRSRAKRPYAVIPAPSNFSIIHNAQEYTEFLKQIDFRARTRNIEIDLSNVTEATTDAAAVLLAKIKSEPLRSTNKFQGSYPSQESAHRLLYDFGFFDHVKSDHLFEERPAGAIIVKHNKLVEGEKAWQLIRHGSLKLLGKPQTHRGAYRALLECMGNTLHHAARVNEPTQPWWATVYADTQSRCLKFTFFDAGIGILSSISPEVRLWYRRNSKPDVELLADMLDGRVGSRTGLEYRGKGLPALRKLADSGILRNFRIVSESVDADVSARRFSHLQERFSGTLLYWEVDYGTSE